MADEAVIIELLGDRGNVVRYTVPDGTAVPKGTVMKITTPRTAVIATSGSSFAGIAAAEKVKDDGSTTLGLYTCGIFELLDDGNEGAAVGAKLSPAGANLVEAADADSMLLGTLGIALANFADWGGSNLPVLIGCGF